MLIKITASCTIQTNDYVGPHPGEQEAFLAVLRANFGERAFEILSESGSGHHEETKFTVEVEALQNEA